MVSTTPSCNEVDETLDTIYIATKNLNKVEEFSTLLVDLHLQVKALPEDLPDCPEFGQTFESNAMEKAAFYGGFCDSWVLADDSGVCVDALGGKPGVHSARYSGSHGNTEANNAKLLHELEGVPTEERGAAFVSVLALYHRKRGIGLIARGDVLGRIAEVPSGRGGFGYDPLFYLPELGCTYADLPMEQKNRFSHRAKAVQVLIHLWRGTCDATLFGERQS